jgi:hypothetical protein
VGGEHGPQDRDANHPAEFADDHRDAGRLALLPRLDRSQEGGLDRREQSGRGHAAQRERGGDIEVNDPRRGDGGEPRER